MTFTRRRKTYVLTEFDSRILEEFLDGGFWTIDDLHNSLSQYPLLVTMRAVHMLTAHGYLQQQRIKDKSFYFLKSKVHRMEQGLREGRTDSMQQKSGVDFTM
ncbi:hypothetical protein [Chryseolinea lacunae]|uniref:Uncharacterized protein n=1 Tax=Chryseolinea lacunae TaxID=2801331 RepID=A0ABS1L2N4_9BACT|nr:hypothetical protein [Chryseolinea lacunae]MBL0745793.1 hypothetical protein [Chryseolinea lacunae]